tara:strand:+ start:555 stop:2138 length:1584 start_codon:yes stop_codon:yes gene_type:complete
MGTGSNLPDPAAGTELLNAINTLVDSTQRTNSLMASQAKEIFAPMSQGMSDMGKSLKPIGTLVKLAQSIFNATIGASLKYDKIILQNSDLNLNTRKLIDQAEAQVIGVGDMDDHLLATLKLQRIGFKNQSVSFRDRLNLLDKQGEQGGLLVEYMAKLSSMGATNEAVETVANAVMEVAENTGTTARASLGSLESMGDIVPLFKALGFEGDVLTGLVEATADMTEQGAIQLGKFAKELLDPEDIAKSFLVGGVQFGDELLASIRDDEGPEEFKRIIQEAAQSMAEAGSDLMSPFDNSVITLQAASDTFMGNAIELAQSTTTAFEVAKSTAIQLDRSSGMHLKGMEAYDESIDKIIDKVKTILQFTAWDAFREMGPAIKELNAKITEFILEEDLFGRISRLVDTSVNVLGSVADKFRDLFNSEIFQFVTGFGKKEPQTLKRQAAERVIERNRQIIEEGGSDLINRFQRGGPEYTDDIMRFLAMNSEKADEFLDRLDQIASNTKVPSKVVSTATPNIHTGFGSRGVHRGW